MTHAARNLRRHTNTRRCGLLNVPSRCWNVLEQITTRQARLAKRDQISNAIWQVHAEAGSLDGRAAASCRVYTIRHAHSRRLAASQVQRDSTRRRMVKHQSARERLAVAESTLKLITKLNRAKRVDARLHQRRVRINRAACRSLHHLQNDLERQR